MAVQVFPGDGQTIYYDSLKGLAVIIQSIDSAKGNVIRNLCAKFEIDIEAQSLNVIGILYDDVQVPLQVPEDRVYYKVTRLHTTDTKMLIDMGHSDMLEEIRTTVFPHQQLAINMVAPNADTVQITYRDKYDIIDAGDTHTWST